MTTDALLKDINEAERDLTLWRSIHDSPGFAHVRELLGQLKTDKPLQDLVGKLFGWDQAKLMESLNAIDNLLLLGDNAASTAAARIALLDKLKAHDRILWAVATMLG